MSVTPGLGAFNKDKVANKFGIQLKPKDAAQRSSTEKKPTPTIATSNVTKNKTISDFRTDNSTNGFLLNNNRTSTPKTPEPIKKTTTSKSTSGLVNTSVKPTEKSKSLTSNDNHSTTKRPSVTPAERATSPAPPTKRPSVPKPKTEAQIEHQKDQPLYRRQLSKPLENIPSSSTTTTTTATAATTPAASSSTSLKR